MSSKVNLVTWLDYPWECVNCKHYEIHDFGVVELLRIQVTDVINETTDVVQLFSSQKLFESSADGCIGHNMTFSNYGDERKELRKSVRLFLVLETYECCSW